MTSGEIIPMTVSIRWALIAGFLGLIWGTQLIITSSSFISSERVLLNHAKSIMENITDLTTEQSKNHLALAQGAAHLTKLLISNNVVSDEMSQLSLLESYFYDQLSIYPHFAGIYYGKPDGEFFYVCRNNERSQGGFRTKIILIKNGIRETRLIWRDKNLKEIETETDPTDTFDPRTRPWYQKSFKENSIVWTDPYIFFTSKKPGITIAGPAKTEDDTIKGIVGVDIDIEQLSTFIGKLKIGKNGRAFMFNNNEDVVAFPDVEKIKKQGPDPGPNLVKIYQITDTLTRKAFLSLLWSRNTDNRLVLDKPRFTKFDHDGKTYHAMFSPFNDTHWPWIIGVFIPEDDYLGSLKANRLLNILITFGISVLATFLALIFSRSIIKPISNLEKEARAVENFDMLTHYDTGSIYKEIQVMSDTFNRMKNSLNNHENEKSRLENQLIRSERLAATGQLAASIAHEINSPLQSVIMLLQTLESKYSSDKELREDLDVMKQVFSTVKNRIKSFQDLNRPYTAIKMPASINEIIETTVNLVRVNLSKNLIKVTLDLEQDLPAITVAFQHICQIFLNLINNAIDAISERSDIDINGLSRDERLPVAGTIHIMTRYEKGYIAITVSDTGPGIDEAILPTVFDLFVTQRKDQGMGIGLAICKGIIKEYNGKIEACNRTGGGAEITIRLPVSP
jgi:signal transduction histidine kinase